MTADRPAVSVVVPFAGSRQSARRLLDSLATLELGPDDELIVADNSLDGAAAGERVPPRSTVVRAVERRSSYHARNAGARAARGDWLLFVDADCEPTPTLIRDYFRQPVGGGVGAIAGAVRAEAAGDGLVARHARSRPYLDQATFLAEPRGGFAATANLLVRRSAWAALGGFNEVRSGGDVDFSWRLQAAGHAIEHRPEAVVRHRHREALWPFVRQRLRYGAGERWLAGRWPGRRRVRHILPAVGRRLVASAVLAARGRREPALFNLLDAVAFGAEAAGWLLGNAAKPWPSEPDPRANR